MYQQAVKRICCQALSHVQQQQVRTTCVVERLFPLHHYEDKKVGHLKKRNYVYKLVDCTHTRPAGNIDVLLLADVEGVGIRGDVVNVTKRKWRNEIFPAGDGVYPTEENMVKLEKEMENEPERPRQSVYIRRTLRDLQGLNVPIPVHPNKDFVLSKTHVKVAFRLVGVELSEDIITLPDEAITAPQELEVKVMVNGLQTVPVKCTVFFHDWERFSPLGLQIYSDPNLGIMPGETT